MTLDTRLPLFSRMRCKRSEAWGRGYNASTFGDFLLLDYRLLTEKSFQTLDGVATSLQAYTSQERTQDLVSQE